MNWPDSHCRIEVSLDRQQVALFRDGEKVFEAFASTAANGAGFEEGSYRTPTGKFVVRERIGEGAPLHTSFKGRLPRKIWRGEKLDDAILTRILWLHGIDSENSNTYLRYIYFHGTNAEDLIGRPASHGCIRLANKQMLELFELTSIGTAVQIS